MSRLAEQELKTGDETVPADFVLFRVMLRSFSVVVRTRSTKHTNKQQVLIFLI